MKNSKRRNWCFTSFKMDLDFNDIYENNKDVIRFLIVQKEQGQKTKKIHWQGYIQLFNQYRLSRVKYIIGDNTLHLESARGSPQENKDYCSKIKTSLNEKYEFGKLSYQGFRTDIEIIKKQCLEGKPLIKIAYDNFNTWIRCYKSVDKFRALLAQQRANTMRDMYVEYIWGKSGVGKTYGVLSKHGAKNVYILDLVGGENIWFDGYDQQKILLIDDFTENMIPINYMLRLLDRYKLRLNQKGGHSWALFNKIYITSNLTLEECYPNAEDEHLTALRRRINKFEHMVQSTL